METRSEDVTCSQCARESRSGRRSTSRGARIGNNYRRRERRRRRSATATGRHRCTNRHGGGHNHSSGHDHGRRDRQGQSPSRRSSRRSPTVSIQREAAMSQTSLWPHSLSFLFASLGLTIGIFGISRFAILTINFGAVFVVQFLLLSVCFGIPLMTFFMSLGQYLGSGLINMWRISPVFQGVGVSLMLVQGLVGVYSIVIISWMFIYFRDSFISQYDQYPWSVCQKDLQSFQNVHACPEPSHNASFRLEETIPDYFSATVLQRTTPNYPKPAFGNLKFQVGFNLVVIWMVVFICLSKGLRSYGKVVYIFGSIPLIGFIICATKIFGLYSAAAFQNWIFETNWSDVIFNAESWVSAARECFLTWGFLGGSMLQLASHNKWTHNLRRDTSLTVLLTLVFLVTSGVLGIALHHVIETQYFYTPSSFETYRSYSFLDRRRMSSSLAMSGPGSSPSSSYSHISLMTGIRVVRPDRDNGHYSGYQVLRLATELIPAYFSILGPAVISPFWAVLFYFSLIMLGIGQVLALFHTIIQGIVAIRPEKLTSWEGSITFACCALGFILGLPMCTEIGIFVVYFLDYTLGCVWWVIVLYLVLMFAVFVVRGKPYGADQVATFLLPKSCCFSSFVSPILAFTWNVVLPICLLIMSVVTFKTGMVSQIFDWSLEGGYIYLPSWVREIGSMLQLLPLLVVPFVGVIQSCRYFLNGPEDLFKRIEMLYRPSFSDNLDTSSSRLPRQADVVLTNFSSSSSTPSNATPTPLQSNDPPPKYTPPPSYSTATGARLARFLRQSFRQSIGRLHQRTAASKPEESPPEYSTVIIETSRQSRHDAGYMELNTLEMEALQGHINQAFANSDDSTAGDAARYDAINIDAMRYDAINFDTNIIDSNPIDTINLDRAHRNASTTVLSQISPSQPLNPLQNINVSRPFDLRLTLDNPLYNLVKI